MTPPAWLHCLADASAWLAAAYPDEGCGLVVHGDAGFRFLPCANIAANPRSAFEIDPFELIRLEDAGATLLAIAHSHPDGPPDFSASDTRAALLADGSPAFPGLDYLVVSVVKGQATDAAVYRFGGGVRGFARTWAGAL